MLDRDTSKSCPLTVSRFLQTTHDSLRWRASDLNVSASIRAMTSTLLIHPNGAGELCFELGFVRLAL